MSNDLTKQYPEMKAQLDRLKPALEAAWPRNAVCTLDRFERACLMIYHQADRRLREAPVSAVIVCIQQLAAIGLLPDKAFGQAYIVCYGGAPQLIIGYRGMVELAYRSGQVRAVKAVAVYEGDEFDLQMGSSVTYTHRPKLGDRMTRPIIGCYAVAALTTGGTVFEWMDRSEIEAIRNISKAGGSGPWAQHFGEMAKKTVIRRLFKMLPVDIETQAAVAAVDAAEFDFDVTPPPVRVGKASQHRGAAALAASLADEPAQLEGPTAEELAELDGELSEGGK